MILCITDIILLIIEMFKASGRILWIGFEVVFGIIDVIEEIGFWLF